MDRLSPMLKDIDLLNIYDNRLVPEAFKERIIEALTLPKTVIFDDKVELDVNIRHPFTFVKDIQYPINISMIDNASTVAEQFASNSDEYRFSSLLMKMIGNVKLTPEYMHSFRRYLSKIIYDFDTKIDILEKVISSNICKIQPFQFELPLIWVCNKSQYFIQFGSEFEAVKPLKIGKDIKIAATDTE